MLAKVRAVTDWLKRVITRPRDELDRWQMAVRFAYDLGRHGARQLRHDRAPQMAAALSFRTLFGLLPVLVVATVLVRAVGVGDWFLEPLDRLFASAGMDEVMVMPPPEIGGESQSLSAWLQQRVREAEQIDMTAIGWVGLAITIYAAAGLMGTIENSFNIICRAPQGRPWTRRFPLYWFILTLSPMAVVLSTFLNSRYAVWVSAIEAWKWLSLGVGFLWSLLIVWLFMFTVYMLFPNRTMEIRPSLIGSLVAAVLLEIGKRTMGAYLSNALSIGQLYGSLGLVPLFMFWVYLMWLVVLFGLQVSATLQMLHGRQLDEVQQRQRQPGLVDPASVLAVMEVITQQFQTGHRATVRNLVETTSIPEHIVLQMLEQLTDAGYLHTLAGDDQAVGLAQPPEKVRADQLIQIGFRMADELAASRPSALAQRLRAVQKELAAEYTLAAASGYGGKG